MEWYYVSKDAQPSGEHEVHRNDCTRLPKIENRIILGCFTNCREAMREARQHYQQVDGCFHCCKPCHTR